MTDAGRVGEGIFGGDESPRCNWIRRVGRRGAGTGTGESRMRGGEEEGEERRERRGGERGGVMGMDSDDDDER